MKTITNYGTSLAPSIYSYLIQPHEKKKKKKCFLHSHKENLILLNAEVYNNSMANCVLTASFNCVSNGVLFWIQSYLLAKFCCRSFELTRLFHVCFVRRKFPSAAATAKQVVYNQAFLIISIKQIARITRLHLLDFFLNEIHLKVWKFEPYYKWEATIRAAKLKRLFCMCTFERKEGKVISMEIAVHVDSVQFISSPSGFFYSY